MSRILTLSTVVVVTIAVVAMGMGGAVAQETETESNESDVDVTYGDVDLIIEQNDPRRASEGTVDLVDRWASNDRLEELNESERERVESWLDGEPVSEDDTEDATNETADNESESDGIDEGINASEIEQTIDSQTAITDWSFADGMFTVEFYAVESTTLTIAESGSMEEGSGDFAYFSRDIPAGESVETFRVIQDSGGATLTFATPLAQEEERGGYISTGTEPDDPFENFGGTSGLFSGVAMTTGLAGLGAFIVVRGEESGVVEA